MKERNYDKINIMLVMFTELCIAKFQCLNSSDSDPLVDPVPDQTMLPTVSLTESVIP